jgi:hypothetical protein
MMGSRNKMETHDGRDPMMGSRLCLDILYRLAPQLTPVDFYFLRSGVLTGTRWCSYGSKIEKKIFLNIFWQEGKSTL